jgi:exonuclease VII large subunit
MKLIFEKNKRITELEEENKMLHQEQWRLHRLWSKDTKHIAELEEENKKLKDSNTILKKGWQVVFTLEKRIDELLEENRKLKEENEIIMRNADGIAHHNVELMKKVKELEKKLWIE